jgi:two-component system, OmpR family, response regulator RegX3
MWRVVVGEERSRARTAVLLQREGLEVESCALEIDLVLASARLAEPDLVILETVSVPNRVVVLCAALNTTIGTPVVVCCENATERDILDAYDAGAQLVINEPVGDHELVARIRAMLRRAPARVGDHSECVVIGSIILDRARRLITVNGVPLPMPRKEFDIAEMLMCRAGTVVSRAQMIRELWGANRDTKTLDVQVGRLRAKLQAAEGRRRILTVRGVGYRFATDDEVEPPVLASPLAVGEAC